MPPYADVEFCGLDVIPCWWDGNNVAFASCEIYLWEKFKTGIWIESGYTYFYLEKYCCNFYLHGWIMFSNSDYVQNAPILANLRTA